MSPLNPSPERDAANKTASTPGAQLHSLKVTLCGESVQVRTDQPPEVVQRLVAYLNARANAVGSSSGLTPENFRLLALAALGITGELFEVRNALEEERKRSEGRESMARSLTDSLDRALADGA